MQENEIPRGFLELYKAGRFAIDDPSRLRGDALDWGSIEWDRGLDEIVSFAGEEGMRPGLIPFAGDGYGNAYCWYPRWQAGDEPPVVFYYHDEEESELFAGSFAECLCRTFLQHFAFSEEVAEDLVAAKRYWQAKRRILDPYLESSHRALLDEVARAFTPEACQKADAALAEKLGSRTLLGIPPPLEIDPSYFSLADTLRHYDKLVSYLRELIEDEGRSEFVGQLEIALARREMAAEAVDQARKSGVPVDQRVKAPRGRRETVVQRPKEGDPHQTFESWGDLSDP